MKVFVGYGYNERDRWIEDDVVPILKVMGFDVTSGKDMHGEELQDGVKDRIAQSHGLIGFCTLRAGQEDADFNTHPWVRDELAFAIGLNLPSVEVREVGVKNPPGLIGDRQRIVFSGDKPLSCVRELITALNGWRTLQIALVPEDHAAGKAFRLALRTPGFELFYRRKTNNIVSKFEKATVDATDNGFFMEARGLPNASQIEIEGRVNGQPVYFTDWSAVNSVQVVLRSLQVVGR